MLGHARSLLLATFLAEVLTKLRFAHPALRLLALLGAVQVCAKEPALLLTLRRHGYFLAFLQAAQVQLFGWPFGTTPSQGKKKSRRPPLSVSLEETEGMGRRLVGQSTSRDSVS